MASLSRREFAELASLAVAGAMLPGLPSRPQQAVTLEETTIAQVQAKLDTNQQSAARNTRHEYLLRALVSCGACQLACTGRQSAAGYRYYLCRGRTDPLRADTDGDGVADGADCFPLDPSRWQCPSPDPNDHTPPSQSLTAPSQTIRPKPTIVQITPRRTSERRRTRRTSGASSSAGTG